ncbi:MAG TPA: alpha/beta hydrolase [Pseudonocardia sp.]|nr:alpha/beta hydrolase [Pseudonocardia sp.]
MHARARSVAICCGALLLLVACGAPTAAPTPDSTSPGPRLDRFYVQSLAWGPCRDYAGNAEQRIAYSAPGFECARLQVPLDYTAPDGTAARIGVLRQRARGGRIGSLVVNPGGPGASGMELVPALSGYLSQSPLGARFDLVGFDPRGVGASVPKINCLDDADWPAERADTDVDPSPAGVESTEAENRAYVQRCTERSGGPAVLANVGTRDVVRDLDILRGVLGDEKLTYLGYSYGSRLGTAYAEAFPQRVRALVLDGALAPDEGIVEQNVEQAVGFQRAFEAFAADCAGRRGCPLGADPAQATAVYQGLVRPLIDAPARAAESRSLSYPDAIAGTNHALYQQSLWSALARGLAALDTGDGTILLALADEYYQRAPNGHYGDLIEGFTVISCVDEQRITDRAEQTELARRVSDAAPFRDTGRGPVGALEPCAFWPVPPTSQPHRTSVTGLPPVLVISTTGDPATPYQAGVELAAELHAELVTFEGNQHTIALQGNDCIDSLVAQYLVELRMPSGSPRCTL